LSASLIAEIFRVVVRSKGLIRLVVAGIVLARIVSVDDCPNSTFRIVELALVIALPVQRWMKT